MKKLVQGILDFRRKVLPGYRETFAKLALGQSPDSLFIACSDSRVVPNLFASSDPGDLFVLRNVGNLIPNFTGFKGSQDNTSAGAAIEFALEQLHVRDIIVCGHSECGAMNALLKETHFPPPSHLQAWLSHGLGALEKFRAGQVLYGPESPANQLSQLNVLEQMEHLKTYPWVSEKMRSGKLRLHGWWFDIAHADVYAYESQENRFLLIDEQESARILQRMENGTSGS
jgi:carbonic anhydrase